MAFRLADTGGNIAKVALNALGDAYGWGGGLNNEDCTSYMRNVYACFGIELPRNGNWQWVLPVPKIDASYMGTEDKEAILDEMPLGTLLTFPGHQMMYLGKYDGNYYVISCVSSIMNPYSGVRQRTRDVQINTLDLKRANGQTWIQAMNHIYYPWEHIGQDEESPMPELPWYQDGVGFCLKNKVLSTYAGGFFRPSETVSRADAVEALWRLMGSPKPEGTAERFSDAADDAAFADAVLWAREKGVTTGFSDGLFYPELPVSREQLAVMLFRLSGEEKSAAGEELLGKEDASDISAWALDALEWAAENGIITGKSADTANPLDELSRAEFAVVVMRASAFIER